MELAVERIESLYGLCKVERGFASSNVLSLVVTKRYPFLFWGVCSSIVTWSGFEVVIYSSGLIFFCNREMKIIGIDLGTSSMKIASWKKSANPQFSDAADMVMNDTSKRLSPYVDYNRVDI